MPSLECFDGKEIKRMKNNSNEISTGAALLMTLGILLVIGMIISAGEPKCSMSSCDNDAKDGSRYCYLHDLSYRTYGNPDYHEVYKNSKSNSNSTTATSSFKTNSKSGSSSGTSAKSSTSFSSGSSKNSSSYDSYDAGYEDVYFDDDYDWDRYNSDPDYASGVDDAMDELDW